MVIIPSLWVEHGTLRVGTVTEDCPCHPSLVPILVHWLLSSRVSTFLRLSFQNAIANAKSLEEVQRLEQMLKKGHVPGSESKELEQNGAEDIEEMDES